MEFLKSRSQTATGLLQKFHQFLTTIAFSQNFAGLVDSTNPQDQERQEEVWKAFVMFWNNLPVSFQPARSS